MKIHVEGNTLYAATASGTLLLYDIAQFRSLAENVNAESRS